MSDNWEQYAVDNNDEWSQYAVSNQQPNIEGRNPNQLIAGSLAGLAGLQAQPRDLLGIASSFINGLALNVPRATLQYPGISAIGGITAGQMATGANIPSDINSLLNMGSSSLSRITNGRTPIIPQVLQPPIQRSKMDIPQAVSPGGRVTAGLAEVAGGILSPETTNIIGNRLPRAVEYFNPISTRERQLELPTKHLLERQKVGEKFINEFELLKSKRERGQELLNTISEKYKPQKQSVPDFLNQRQSLIENEIKNLAFEAPEIAKIQANKLIKAGNDVFGNSLENITIKTTKGDVINTLENAIDDIGGSKDILGSGANKIDAIVKRIGKYKSDGSAGVDLEEVVDNKFLSDLTKEITRSTSSRDTAIVYKHLVENLDETAKGLPELKAIHRNTYRLAKESKMITPRKIREIATGKLGSKELQVMSGAEESLKTDIVSRAMKLNDELNSVTSDIEKLGKYKNITPAQQKRIGSVQNYVDKIDRQVAELRKITGTIRKELSVKQSLEREKLAKELLSKKARIATAIGLLSISGFQGWRKLRSIFGERF